MPTETPHGRVWNKREAGIPDDAVYIGRPSILGNPYVIGKNGSREQVIELFEDYARYSVFTLNQEFLQALKEVVGKDVICWCSPADCHGRIVLELAAELGNND